MSKDKLPLAITAKKGFMRIKLRPGEKLPRLEAIQVVDPDFTKDKFRSLQGGEKADVSDELGTYLLNWCEKVNEAE